MGSNENNLLGEFKITGIERAKRGEPQVDVSFSIDSNGILTVVAKDQKTGAHADIQIANRAAVSKEEIEKMIADAAEHKKEDEERIRKLEAKHELEVTIGDVFEVAKGMDDSNLAEILIKSATQDQQWLEDCYEDSKCGEINLRR